MTVAQSIPVDNIQLDLANPRIKQFLAMYSLQTEEAMLLALGAGADAPEDDDNNPDQSFNKLKHSIRSSGGIIQPIIVQPIDREHYRCIEGNTRVAIYRQLYNEATRAGRDAQSWAHIPAVVDTEMDEHEAHKIRLQVHLVGNRAWDPYSKARYLNELLEDHKMPLTELVGLCGGSRADIDREVAAYRDMETHYRPLIEDKQGRFNPRSFSAFVELQRPGVKDALYEAGYSERHFSDWVDNQKIAPLNTVRRLPQILKDPTVRDIFLTQGAREAVKHLDAPESNSRLHDAGISELARALQEKLDNLLYDDTAELIRNQSDDYLDLVDLLSTINGVFATDIAA